MDGSTETHHPWFGVEVTEGPWKGWKNYTSDPFELMTGPYYHREEADGRIVCAFRAEKKHMNGSGAMHGGLMLTFADYAIFQIAGHALDDVGSVTASLNGEFIDAAEEGELIECRGDLVRAGGSLVFVRGIVTASGRPILNFSAIIKKIRPRPR
jgi:acyl-coenzyme A thioesterase PaaI-like protein